jgi:DNA-binding transcriptional ArsR family regulator
VNLEAVSGNLRFVAAYGVAGGLALEALGDPTRRAIFELLARGPRPVVELADSLPVSRPAISQHLKVLKQAGVVIDHAEGTRRIYRVDPAGVAAMRAYLDQMWDTALGAFVAAAETEASERSSGLEA